MATHHGYLAEFPWIRIDAFDGGGESCGLNNPYTPGKAPSVYLLTHAHTDHIVGLDSPSFSGLIYCHPQTKKLLLGAMTAADRVRHEELGLPKAGLRRFANLWQTKTAVKGGGGRGRDRIKEIPYNTPTQIRSPDGTSEVTVVALDANHCPGSCMFLISGPSPSSAPVASTSASSSSSRLPPSPPPTVTILHTGDLRAEPWWLEALKRNPHVQPYLAPSASARWEGKGGEGEEEERRGGGLWRIYLDTSGVGLDEELVPRDEAIATVIEIIKRYPSTTKFFINCWTWGYEDLLKAIYLEFGEPIHLDWYKHSLYTSSSFRLADPLLVKLGTTSPRFPPSPSRSSNPVPSPSLRAPSSSSAPPVATKPLRFHACERRWRCDETWAGGVGCYAWEKEYLPSLGGPKKLKTPCCAAEGGGGREEGNGKDEGETVFINPCEMPRWRWEGYLRETLGGIDGKAKEGREKMEKEEGKGKGSRRTMWKAEEERARKGLGGLPKSLIVPLARHSTLPELHSLISLFRPLNLTPLTTAPYDPHHPAYDYLSLAAQFGGALGPGGAERLRGEADGFKREIIREARRKGKGKGRAAESSPGDGVEGGAVDLGGLTEPQIVQEMARRGLQVEGGYGAFREAVRWGVEITKEEVERMRTGGGGGTGEGEEEGRGWESRDAGEGESWETEVEVEMEEEERRREAERERNWEEKREAEVREKEERKGTRGKNTEKADEVIVLDTDSEDDHDDQPLCHPPPTLPRPTSASSICRSSSSTYEVSRQRRELGRCPSPFLVVPSADAAALATTTDLLAASSMDTTPSQSPPPVTKVSSSSRKRKHEHERTPDPTVLVPPTATIPPTVLATSSCLATATTAKKPRRTVAFVPTASPSPKQRSTSTSAAMSSAAFPAVAEISPELRDPEGQKQMKSKTGVELFPSSFASSSSSSFAAPSTTQPRPLQVRRDSHAPFSACAVDADAVAVATPALLGSPFAFHSSSSSSAQPISSFPLPPPLPAASTLSHILTPTVPHYHPSSSASSCSPRRRPAPKTSSPVITAHPLSATAEKRRVLVRELKRRMEVERRREQIKGKSKRRERGEMEGEGGERRRVDDETAVGRRAGSAGGPVPSPQSFRTVASSISSP